MSLLYLNVRIRTSLHDLARNFTPRTNPRSEEDQDPRHKGQDSPNPAEQATSSLEAHPSEHLLRDKRERASQQIPTHA